MAAVLLGVTLGRDATAQTPTVDPGTADRDSLLRAIAAKLVRVVGSRVATIDARAKTATVRLFNPGSDTAVVKVFLQFSAPANKKPLSAEGLLEEDQATLDSVDRARVREDSLGRIWSVEKWVKEPLPAQLWLAPHQTVVLTLHFAVPPSLAPGEYSAYFVAAPMMVRRLPTFTVQVTGNAPARNASFGGVMILDTPEMLYPRAAVRLVYTVGETPVK